MKLDCSKSANEVLVDMKLSIIKEASAQWLEVAYHIKGSESIIY